MKKKTNHHLHHRNNRNSRSTTTNNNNNNSVLDILQGIIFCRRRRLHGQLLPFISAIGGCILFFFAIVSFLSPPINHHHVHRFGFYNHSSLDDEIDFRSNIGNTSTFLIPRAGGSLGDEIWRSTQSQSYHGCSQKSDNFQDADAKTNDSRFLMIVTSGGLNQQRTGITDAVVAAYILNSTLVVPKLDNKSYWKDQSNFSDIFDVDWFISYLSKDVKIVKEVPMIDGRSIHPYQMRIPRKCDPECYHSRALPILEKKKVLMLTKFDYRLANRLDTDLQKLRCRANYHALRYTDPIREMGEKLVERMRMKSKHFIALHLRFESDMLAFSGCYFGGGDKERQELEQIRTRWETLHKRDPDKERKLGRCPLTPEEVGLMLRALGYGEDVHIYVASGEVYGGENALSPLKQLFPNYHSKDTIATKEELAPFSPYSSRMAALDFIVCNASDVFVTNNNGNMAKMLAGRRRYFGYKPTITPNAKKLYRLFLDRGNMTWEEFASRVRTHQIGFMGRPNEALQGKGEFHEYPIACICEDLRVQIQNRSQLGQNQNQSEPYNHDVQANKHNRNESEIIVVKELQPNEGHNSQLGQNQNQSEPYNHDVQANKRNRNESEIIVVKELQPNEGHNSQLGQNQNQSEPYNHDVQANKRNRNESEIIVVKELQPNEGHNISYAQQMENKNETQVKELPIRNKNESNSGLEDLIKGRSILDGTLVINEILDWAKRSKNQMLIFKIDFEKAFDSLNWGFLDDILAQMGFGDRWRAWVRGCITTTRVSILVNGSPTKEFRMEKGVRHGDPLAPFLFILAMEGLYVAMKEAQLKGIFKGIHLDNVREEISILQYADDAIFLGDWTRRNVTNLIRILQCFHICSGLKINFLKSKLIGVNVHLEETKRMARRLNCKTGTLPFNYLGIPVGENMNKATSWKPIVEKFKSRLSKWKASTLSIGGRLCLCKSVLGSLGNYYFSLYKAPMKVINALESIRCKFFWGGNKEKKKICWIAWKEVINDKRNGGLGIGSLRALNLALLGKWWGRFFSESHSTWKDIIISRHGNLGGLLDPIRNSGAAGN
ncbi:hypothetical protein OSB04_005821 [Centaurea solstitialis]|uniref:O-fucosyltransferase family protein n=1 Tax=Centaurea solstitialis TaxID=347529 RepID=A0AA38WSB7_9ASTR|nr:hypothetical protein OSB04_005821 [Centaurea solstitialis]